MQTVKEKTDFPGFFCVLEGINASGKTTLLRNLANQISVDFHLPVFQKKIGQIADADVLVSREDNSGTTIEGSAKRQIVPGKEKAQGFQIPSCLLTREPTDSSLGQEIRRRLNEHIPTSRRKWLQLFMKDRWHHQQNILMPALQKGVLILSDRYFYSSAAYQGCADVLDAANRQKNRRTPHFILQIHERSQFCNPDLIFYLRMQPEESIRRQAKIQKKPDVHENLPYLKQVHENYETIFQENRCNGAKVHRVVSHDGDPMEIIAECYPILLEGIRQKRKNLQGNQFHAH